MHSKLRVNIWTISVFTSFLFIFLGIAFLDELIAKQLIKFLNSHKVAYNLVAHIPNTLPSVTFWSTLFFLTLYLASLRFTCLTKLSGFLKLAVVTLPMAFAIKLILQCIFDRTNIRDWWCYGGEVHFNWFNFTRKHGGFPSGHMTVFSALIATACASFPRMYLPGSIVLTVLGLALILTNYHFMSDVIAGLLCGVTIVYTITLLYKNRR